MRDDGYTTPEGHWLARPILLPDVRDFADLFDYLSEWDHSTMSPTGGRLPETRPEPVKVGGNAFGAGNEVGPYCNVDLSAIETIAGKRYRGIAVRAKQIVVDAIEPRIVTSDDRLSFKVIGHARSGRALVIAEHGYIIGSHWLAYIDPATVPALPETAEVPR